MGPAPGPRKRLEDSPDVTRDRPDSRPSDPPKVNRFCPV
jgi:hypothetical protein